MSNGGKFGARWMSSGSRPFSASMSAPAQNARPEPVSTMTRTFLSAAAASMASRTSRSMIGVHAFMRSGQRDGRDPFADVVENMLIGHERSPCACFSSASLLADTITSADLERRSRLLFRGFQHHRQRRSSQPAIEKSLQPGTLGHVVDGAIGEVVMAGGRAPQPQSVLAPHWATLPTRPGPPRTKTANYTI